MDVSPKRTHGGAHHLRHGVVQGVRGAHVTAKVFFGSFFLAQIIIFAVRHRASGVQFSLLRRLHEVVNLEFFMVLCSSLIWKRASAALNFYHVSVPKRHGIPRKAIGLADVIKTLLAVFLVCTHLSWLWFYVFLRDEGDEPHPMTLISFVCTAIYIHVVIFTFFWVTVEGTGSILFGYNPDSTGVVGSFFGDKHAHTVSVYLIGVALTCAGMWVTTRPPSIYRVTVKVENLSDNFENFQIALLTDLHIGPTVGRSRVQQIVETVNALNPDLVAISGDLVDGHKQDLYGAVEPLAFLLSKHGTYFVTGNHEYYHGDVVEWMGYLKSVNVEVLHNSHRKLYPAEPLDGSDYLCIAGVDDLFATKMHISGHEMDWKQALGDCDPKAVVVLLVHQPNGAKLILDDPLAGAVVDVALSGHTHGGQLYPMFPLAYLSNAYLHGLYAHSDSTAQVYVSAGTNFWGPPVKMFGLCEVTLITLQRA